MKAYNGRLLGTCLELSDGKPHYRKGASESELFGDDRAALSPLPAAPFACVTWLTRKCDKQGSFRAGGEHRYSAGPANASREVAVAMGAFDVTVVGAGGEVVAEYPREWGDAPTDSADPTLQLRLLCVRPGGWRDSVVRGSLPEQLVAFLDSESPADLGADLRALRDVSARRGWAATVEGALRSLGATGGVDAATLELAAARAAPHDASVEYDEPVDLAGTTGPSSCWRGAPPVPRIPDAEREEFSLARQVAVHIEGDDSVVPRDGDPGPARRVLGDARARARVPRAVEARPAAAPGPLPRTQGRGGVRLVQRALSRGLGPRRDALARLRGARRGPRLPRPDRPRQDARGDGPRHRGDPARVPVRFFQTATLVLQLGKAKREGRSTGCWRTSAGPSS